MYELKEDTINTLSRVLADYCKSQRGEGVYIDKEQSQHLHLTLSARVASVPPHALHRRFSLLTEIAI